MSNVQDMHKTAQSTSEIILHPDTLKNFNLLVNNPSHAIGIFGLSGIGKTFIAENLAAKIMGIPYSKLHLQPYYKLWSPDEKGVIKLEKALEIVSFMKLKTTGKKRIRRIAIVEHAECLTVEAQNALLKTIEEPPTDTVIILTASQEQLLLKTIISRLGNLDVKKPAKQELINYFSELYPDINLERNYLVSFGMPGIFYSLSSQATDHPKLAIIQSAKDLLRSDTFTRLTLVDSYSERQAATALVESLAQIAQTGMAAAAGSNNIQALKRWHGISNNLQLAQTKLNSSGSPKLVLTDLFLHI